MKVTIEIEARTDHELLEGLLGVYNTMSKAVADIPEGASERSTFMLRTVQRVHMSHSGSWPSFTIRGSNNG